MTRTFWLFPLIACGSATPTTAPPVMTPSPDAAVAAPADAESPADAAPEPEAFATLGNILSAGPHTPEDIAALLSVRELALAACLSGDGVARATEVSLIAIGNETRLRVAWQNGAPVALPCLAEALGGTGELAINYDTKFSTVYAVIRSVPADTVPPPLPPPPDRKADVKLLFCDLEIASGADKLSGPAEKQQAMIEYGRAHAKHPAAIHIALEVTQWNPAERVDNLKRAIRHEGIKKCALQRF